MIATDKREAERVAPGLQTNHAKRSTKSAKYEHQLFRSFRAPWSSCDLTRDDPPPLFLAFPLAFFFLALSSRSPFPLSFIFRAFGAGTLLLNSFDLSSKPGLHRFLCSRLIVCELEVFNRLAGIVQRNSVTRHFSRV